MTPACCRGRQRTRQSFSRLAALTCLLPGAYWVSPPRLTSGERRLVAECRNEVTRLEKGRSPGFIRFTRVDRDDLSRILPELGLLDRPKVAFCLAMNGVGLRENVYRMLEVYRLDKLHRIPGDEAHTQLWMDLPDELERVYVRRRDPYTLAALLDLDADGFFAELVDDTRLSLLRRFPTDFVRAACANPGRFKRVCEALGAQAAAGGDDRRSIFDALHTCTTSDNAYVRRSAKRMLRRIMAAVSRSK